LRYDCELFCSEYFPVGKIRYDHVMLRVLTLSTLFPNPIYQNFGVFVGNQTMRLAARADVELRVISPVPVPPFPLHRHKLYRDLCSLPAMSHWAAVPVFYPRFPIIPSLSAPINAVLLYRKVKPLLTRMRAEGFDFDVIDAEFFYPDGPAAARLAHDFGVPFSVKARGDDIHYWGARAFCRRQILDAAKHAGGMLAVAASLKRDMIAMGMQESKIAVHYTGVDLERFRPLDRTSAKAALGVSGPLVVSLGALIPRKGHHLVIETIRQIPQATLLIAGTGPEQASLQALIDGWRLGSRVRLLGGLPHAELPALLGAADVMALASESEGLANAWVEALACGTPIVIPAVDGAIETVDRPAAGRLISERTPAAIAAAILDILADPPAQDEVRASSERFNWARNTQSLFDHLSRLCRSGS
jgi:teichuronic acid biosynthesis glycosyltransferase TuaC